MRYWESSTRRPAAGRKKSHPQKGSIASGGSIREYPFLRRFYQHQSAIGDKLQRLIFFLIVAALLYVFVLGDGGAIRILSLQKQRAELERELDAMKLNIEQLQSEIDRLKADPFIMEKLGRERYGYVFPGERVYKIVPGGETK